MSKGHLFLSADSEIMQDNGLVVGHLLRKVWEIVRVFTCEKIGNYWLVIQKSFSVVEVKVTGAINRF